MILIDIQQPQPPAIQKQSFFHATSALKSHVAKGLFRVSSDDFHLANESLEHVIDVQG